ncbi:helix-turn-helix domain-containing protein [Sphingobacterium zeae]|uniref:Transcriptional regulator with XRE-family HTH domain n=1 Tax=Sphingobacterium zeae TaxID=1776859 RepID=A0ABU0U3R2_9SPHI|nr:helix-turn-helix transcriptional regulator [Sphingobacterium zeae]MDQ1149484.1 transcriptional regulator with XRE-family HTH domain [Sphingobacterium zeae]
MADINENILEEIGEELRIQREKIYYTLKDVANMTGLTTNTVSAIEKGKGSSLNNFILICRALKIQPHKIFRKEIDLTPLYNIPPESKRRIELTKELDDLVYNSNFFEIPRRVSDIIQQLNANKDQSNKFSVYLSGYCKEGTLEYEKHGNYKQYRKNHSAKPVKKYK